MAGVNKAIILGHLGDDPKIKFLPDGGAVVNLSVATSESWKDKSGQKQTKTEWHKIVFYNKLAEIAAEFLRKGSKAYIEGSIKTRKWTDQSGTDKYVTEIIGSSLQLIDSKPKEAEPVNSVPAQTYTPSPSNANDDDEVPF